MFAHQVIEDILKMNKEDMKVEFLNPNIQRKDYLEWAKSFISPIKESQKFHLPSIEQSFEIGKSMSADKLFKGNNGGVRLPYKKCWFDYL
jgi:hypothetical protein